MEQHLLTQSPSNSRMCRALQSSGVSTVSRKTKLVMVMVRTAPSFQLQLNLPLLDQIHCAWHPFPFAESSLQSVSHFCHSVVSDSLQPRESQHTSPPCPSQTPRVYSNSCPLLDAFRNTPLQSYLSCPALPSPFCSPRQTCKHQDPF